MAMRAFSLLALAAGRLPSPGDHQLIADSGAAMQEHEVVWGNSPLRPEFAESTYMLYTATHDPVYLEVVNTACSTAHSLARTHTPMHAHFLDAVLHAAVGNGFMRACTCDLQRCHCWSWEC